MHIVWSAPGILSGREKPAPLRCLFPSSHGGFCSAYLERPLLQTCVASTTNLRRSTPLFQADLLYVCSTTSDLVPLPLKALILHRIV